MAIEGDFDLVALIVSDPRAGDCFRIEELLDAPETPEAAVAAVEEADFVLPLAPGARRLREREREFLFVFCVSRFGDRERARVDVILGVDCWKDFNIG